MLRCRRFGRIRSILLLTAAHMCVLGAIGGCHEGKVITDTLGSIQEGSLVLDRKWDIQEGGRKLLLVMVHGFNSSSEAAWGDFPKLILEDKDKTFGKFNVLRYGYNSRACRNKVEISELGDGLKSYLSDELRRYDGMIVMAHSMGGLVAMHALLALAKEKNQDLASMPVTLMTFGTPHLGVFAAERLTVIGHLCADKQAEGLEVFKNSLNQLRNDWDSQFGTLSQYKVDIRTFYGPEDFFVYHDSACGRFPHCEQVDGNHVMIVKPTDRNHLAYRKLTAQVCKMLTQGTDDVLEQMAPPSPEQEQALHSLHTVTAAQIRFENKKPYPVLIYWLDENGRRRLMRKLEPGLAYGATTFETHPWIVTKENGAAIARFMPQAGFRRAVINGSDREGGLTKKPEINHPC